MKKNKAYIYKLKHGRHISRNEQIKNTAAILSLVAVETILLMEYLNQCINHILNY